MNDKEILQALGNRIRDLINEREYHSAYQFWIYEAFIQIVNF